MALVKKRCPAATQDVHINLKIYFRYIGNQN
jgi:hypothetical protein